MIAYKPVSDTVSAGAAVGQTLEVTSNVLKRGRIPIYVEGSHPACCIFILTQLSLEKLGEIRGCSRTLSHT